MEFRLEEGKQKWPLDDQMDEMEVTDEILFFVHQKMKIHFYRINTKKSSKLTTEKMVGQKTNMVQIESI
jgi:hypothetical protein